MLAGFFSSSCARSKFSCSFRDAEGQCNNIPHVQWAVLGGSLPGNFSLLEDDGPIKSGGQNCDKSYNNPKMNAREVDDNLLDVTVSNDLCLSGRLLILSRALRRLQLVTSL